MQEHLVCVDDELFLLESLKQELRQDVFFSDINIEIVDNASRALDLVTAIEEDGGVVPAVISDQRMPSMTGDAFLSELHRGRPQIHKILLTGFSDLDAVVRLVNQNALYRYIAKPWDKHDMLLTLREAITSYRRRALIEQQTLKIEQLTLAMVSSLESTNFYYDEETGSHIQRIALISEYIAGLAGCDEAFIRQLKLYAPLHDIGKVGIDKQILQKPGKLSLEEYDHMKDHVTIGAGILKNQAIDPMARNIVLYHHEKWNGRGYAAGLAGEEIPLEARIVSLADVFDALVSKRVYKPPFMVEEAVEIIGQERGESFDPALVDLFVGEIFSMKELKAKIFGFDPPSAGLPEH